MAKNKNKCDKCGQTRYMLYDVLSSEWGRSGEHYSLENRINFRLCSRCLIKHVQSGKKIEDFLSAKRAISHGGGEKNGTRG